MRLTLLAAFIRVSSWPIERAAGGNLFCGSGRRILHAQIVSELTVRRIGDSEIVTWREPDRVRQVPPSYGIEVTPGNQRSLTRPFDKAMSSTWRLD